MAKCLTCNSCVTYSWIDGIRYLYCAFCNKFYSVVNGKLQHVYPSKPEPLKIVEKPKKKKGEIRYGKF